MAATALADEGVDLLAGEQSGGVDLLAGAPALRVVTPDDLAEAERPARMTMTRGGQPVLVARALAQQPVPPVGGDETAAKPPPPWAEVLESLPIQLVAGTISAVKNLEEMGLQDILSRLTEPRKPATSPRKIAERERDKAKIAEYEKLLQSATPEAARAREILRDVTPQNMTIIQQAVSSLAQSSPSTLVGIAAGVLTKNPILAMTIAGGGGAAYQTGATYGEATEKGAPHKIASMAAKIDGILEGAGESLGLGYALKSGAPILKRIISTIAVEAGQEAATQLAQDTNAFLSYNPEITLGEVWNNLQVASLAGAMGGAVYGGAGAALESQSGGAKAGRELAKEIEATDISAGTEQVAADLLSPEHAQLRMVPKTGPAAVQQPTAKAEPPIPEAQPAQAPPTEPAEALQRPEDIPEDLVIHQPTFVEDTGETVQVKRNAREAVREADQRVNRYNALIECMGR